MDTTVMEGEPGERRVEGVRRRRLRSFEDKRRIVAESYEPGLSVSQVARRNDVNANLLFTWRRQLREPLRILAPRKLHGLRHNRSHRYPTAINVNPDYVLDFAFPTPARRTSVKKLFLAAPFLWPPLVWLP